MRPTRQPTELHPLLVHRQGARAKCNEVNETKLGLEKQNKKQPKIPIQNKQNESTNQRKTRTHKAKRAFFNTLLLRYARTIIRPFFMFISVFRFFIALFTVLCLLFRSCFGYRSCELWKPNGSQRASAAHACNAEAHIRPVADNSVVCSSATVTVLLLACRVCSVRMHLFVFLLSFSFSCIVFCRVWFLVSFLFAKVGLVADTQD